MYSLPSASFQWDSARTEVDLYMIASASKLNCQQTANRLQRTAPVIRPACVSFLLTTNKVGLGPDFPGRLS